MRGFDFEHVAAYCFAEQIAEYPDFLPRLKEMAGLDTIIVAGAFKPSDEVLAANPIPGQQPRTVRQGIAITEDDATLRKAVEIAHRHDIAVWLLISGWWGGAERAPDLMMRHLDGGPISRFAPARYASESDTLTFCPNRAILNEWFARLYVDLVRRYDVQGIDLTHARYSHPAFIESLFGCGCEHCARTAAELGYDFDEMTRGVLRFLDRLGGTSAGFFEEAADLNMGFFDFLQFFGGRELMDWFHFRADCITRRLVELRTYFKSHVGRDAAFVSDSFVPSFALMVGHRYEDFPQFSDYLTPLLPWLQAHYLSTFAAITHRLTTTIEGLREGTILRLLYRFFGYDRFDMPRSLAGLRMDREDCESGFGPLYSVVETELRKAALYNGGRLKSWPSINAGVWPVAVIRRLLEAISRAGHQGVIWQMLRVPGGSLGQIEAVVTYGRGRAL